MQKLKFYNLILLITGILICLSCAQVPTYEIWRPWTRSLSTTDRIVLGKTIQIEIDGKTDPLLGEEVILKKEMKNILENLLIRRGYTISTQTTDYKLKFSFNSKHDIRTSSRSMLASSNLNAYLLGSIFGSNYSSNLGVNLATAMIYSASKSSTFSKQKTISKDNYVHTISIDIIKNDKVIWVGDSKWNSSSVDIRTDIFSAIQILLSDLPSNESLIPRVKEVKEDYALNYFRIYCWNNWFASPALPYRIYFDDLKGKSKIPKSVNNNMAFAAYLDLMQTAEYALPVGINNAKSPLNRDLWKKVMLGGIYYIGDSNKKHKILIKLKGESSGYEIEKCWVASDEEYQDYLEKLSRWKEFLEDYYNVYK